MIAGTNSGVGKTTVTLGAMSALALKRISVQGFKAGQDYIDPSHHTFVTGNASRNLDTWIMGNNACRELFERSAVNADISVIEGVMGLYDGSIDSTGHGSSAYLAKVLNTPETTRFVFTTRMISACLKRWVRRYDTSALLMTNAFRLT